MKKTRKLIAAAALLAGTTAAILPVSSQLRIRRANRPLTDRWKTVPVRPRGTTSLGISFRPGQAEEMGLDPADTLRRLLEFPYHVIRLSAYWNHLEPAPGKFVPAEFDRMVEDAEAAGKKIIISVGPVKSFGYPEFFVPDHHLPEPLPEGTLITPRTHGALLSAATSYITQVIARYRDRESVIAWQVEHEAVDPLGMEHSWRLSSAFVRSEVAAARVADPTRPILMNGFLPTSTPVGAQQWWRTRDQGDSLDVARELADIVGIDFYPRHAMTAVGDRSIYLAGSKSPWQQRRRRKLMEGAAESGQELMVSEGQAEPWEAITNPPNPERFGMYSCLPETLIENYNECMDWNDEGRAVISSYLFWGAEYWILRQRSGDSRYVDAFKRVIEEA